jgi:hypothetical protein
MVSEDIETMLIRIRDFSKVGTADRGSHFFEIGGLPANPDDLPAQTKKQSGVDAESQKDFRSP